MVINTINGSGGIRPPNNVRRTTKSTATDGASFSRHLDETSETESTHATQATSPLNQISGVLSLQEVDDALARAAKGKLRAQDMLDRLDELRMDLLTGTISRDKLLRLAHIVNSRRGEISDPKLVEILDQIDLRAQVELAKYSSTL